MIQEQGNVPIYLETGTHWRPEMMELAAREVASVVGTLPSTKQRGAVPGSIPYKDHIAAIELSELSSSASLLADSTHAVVYLWSMRDNVWTRQRGFDRVIASNCIYPPGTIIPLNTRNSIVANWRIPLFSFKTPHGGN